MNTLLNRLLARLLLLPIIVIGVGLLLKGYQQGGGGFSGGMVVALGILQQYVVFGHRQVQQALPLIGQTAQWLAAVGLGLMLVVSFAPLLAGRVPLTHVPEAGASPVHLGTLELHTSLLFELGIFLLVTGFAVTVLHLLGGWGDEDV